MGNYLCNLFQMSYDLEQDMAEWEKLATENKVYKQIEFTFHYDIAPEDIPISQKFLDKKEEKQ